MSHPAANYDATAATDAPKKCVRDDRGEEEKQASVGAFEGGWEGKWVLSCQINSLNIISECTRTSTFFL